MGFCVRWNEWWIVVLLVSTLLVCCSVCYIHNSDIVNPTLYVSLSACLFKILLTSKYYFDQCLMKASHWSFIKSVSGREVVSFALGKISFKHAVNDNARTFISLFIIFYLPAKIINGHPWWGWGKHYPPH